MKPSLLTFRIMSFTLLVGQVLGACALVPGPAFSRVVRAPEPLADRLAPGDRIAVVGWSPTRDGDSTTVCVRNALVKTRPAARLVPVKQYREALPGFTFPGGGTSEDAQRVGDVITELGLRYVIQVGTMDTPKTEKRGPGVGAMWMDRESTVSAEVWDVKASAVVGTMTVTASGKNVGVGMLPACTLFSVISLSMTETTACRALGRELAEFLADAT